jgi:hypothetical protein
MSTVGNGTHRIRLARFLLSKSRRVVPTIAVPRRQTVSLLMSQTRMDSVHVMTDDDGRSTTLRVR